MKYQFSFQKVLDVKEKEKELAEQEYESIRLQQLEVQEKIEGVKDSKERILKQYDQVNRRKVSDFLHLQQEVDYINQQLKDLENHSHELHQKVEKKQQVLIEKTKEAKIWNQWKAKSLEAFQKRLIKEEQALMDEMAVLRYFRKV